MIEVTANNPYHGGRGERELIMDDYNIWRGSDGTINNIADMSDAHIKNCITHIGLVMNELGIDADMEKDYGIIGRGYDFNERYLKPTVDRRTLWYCQHGKNYIEAFKEELSRR
ncbi:MAG: hypothetical protein WC343_13725 [Bacilli bacterium]|jgi:hypothetical protein